MTTNNSFKEGMTGIKYGEKIDAHIIKRPKVYSLIAANKGAAASRFMLTCLSTNLLYYSSVCIQGYKKNNRVPAINGTHISQTVKA